MNLRRSLAASKRAFKSRLRRFGFDVVKVPGSDYPRIDLMNLFADRLNQSGGSVQVLQVGANDGVESDSLRELVLKNPHWSAILVEPQKRLLDSLAANYAEAKERITLENVAVAPGPGEISFYFIDHPTDLSLSVYSSTNRNHVSKSNPYADRYIKEVRVPCMGISDILERNHVKALDFLVVDTEGYDWEVLKTVDFNRHRPTIIQFESGHLSLRDRREAFETLSGLGYSMHWNGADSYALLEEA